jgi:hypothetical protein
VRGKLGAEIATPLVRVPHACDERLEGRRVELRRRDDHALLVERARARRKASRLGAADIRVMRARDREPQLGARHDRQIREVGAARVRVVEDPGLAERRIVRHHRRHRLRHGAEVDGDVLRLRDHPAALVEKRR